MRHIFAFILAVVLTTATSHAQSKGTGKAADLDQLQDQIRELRGQVEELTHQVNKLKQFGNPADNDLTTRKMPAAPTKNLADETPVTKSSMLADQPTNSSGSRISPAANSTNDYNEARTLLDQKRFAEAEVALTQFIKKYPKDPLTVNAHYWLAETHYIRADYPQAALKFGEAYQSYMDHKNAPYKEQAMSKGPEIIFKLASSLYNIGKYNDAKVTLEELNEEFKQLPGNIRQQADVLRREIANKAKSAG
jgi:tol-pal system protein YbgF